MMKNDKDLIWKAVVETRLKYLKHYIDAVVSDYFSMRLDLAI